MTSDSSYSLEALTRRWQSEKSPQLGLQLAEEHRRKGDLPSAIDVLEKGLVDYPDHTASKAALGRYLTDVGRFDAAVAHLEKLVLIDPTHPVANKLLVRAYTGVGRFEDASEKLDIYEMLAPGDDAIEELRSAVEGDVPVPAAAATPVADRVAESDLPTSDEVFGDSAEILFGAEESQEPTGLVEPAESAEKTEPAEPAEKTEPADQAGRSAPVAAGGSEEPFGDSWGTEGVGSQYWADVASEGIFAVVDAGEAPSPAVEEGPTPFDSQPAEAFEPSPEVPDPRPPARPAAQEEHRSEPAEADLPSSDEPESNQAADLEDNGRPPSDATVTLGGLYLEQGHKEEAARTFEAVLDREPDSEAARAGLDAALGATADDPVTPSSENSMIERKKEILTDFLEKIRSARQAEA